MEAMRTETTPMAAPAAASAAPTWPRSKPLSQRLTSISTLLFYAGLIAIPFDNLVFAPSGGWATIAPMIFFVYVCFNLPQLARVRFNVPLALGAFAVVALQCVNIFIYGITLDALLDALFTFVLGLFFYFALIIRYEQQKASFNRDATVLYRAYIVAFVYGILWLIATALESDFATWFDAIERRPYPRLAFSFTEPSFISLHVFGVLFLYTYFVSDRRLARKMLILGGLFLVFAIITRSSARAITDAVAFLGLLLARTTWVDRKHSARNIMLWVIIIGLGLVAVFSSSRIQSILTSGISSDGSMASRFFRIEAMFYGFADDPLAMLFGYGPGNMIVPFQEGYDQAFATYTNSYVREVNYLGVAASIDNIYSMPPRLISDLGLIVTLTLTVLLIWGAKCKKIDPCVVIMTLWLYVQFDSYAFYSLWLLIFLYRAYNPKTMGVSYFDLFRGEIKNADALDR